MKTKKTFEQWLKEVDEAVQAKCYLSIHDLPDCPYHDWYDDGKTVKGAASAAVRMAKE